MSDTHSRTSDDRPTVSVIVVNYNGAEVLTDCLESILAQDYVRLEILVVDNASQDGSTDNALLSNPRVRLMRMDENLGFAEANNRAIVASSGELIALVNNDTVLAADWVRRMADALQAEPRAGAAAGTTLQAHAPAKIDAVGFAFYSCCSCDSWSGVSAEALDRQRHQPFGPVASAAVYRRSALDEVGLFHPEYFCYYEDTDLAVRLVLFGYSTTYAPQALAYHRGSHTGRRQSAFHVYHLRRNAEYLYWVDMVGLSAFWHLPYHLAHESLAFLAAIKRGQGLTVLRAKLDAMRNISFILRQRLLLARRLRARGGDGLRLPRRQLAARMRLGLPLGRLLPR